MVKTTKTSARTLDKQNAELFKKLLHLAITIADKYDDNRAYEAALVGLYTGINLYSLNDRKEDIDLYVIWFIKTSIEYSLGRDTEDTRMWKTKIVK